MSLAVDWLFCRVARRCIAQKMPSLHVSRPGFEPGTKGLKVPCSTVELAARGVHQV